MSEGYPAEWKHCTIHLNPKTEEMHSDGDHSVREWIENRHRALQRDLTLALKLGQGTAEDRDQKEKDLSTERDQFGKRETEHIKKVRIEIGRRTLAEGKIIKLEVALENIINKIVPIYAKEHGILVSEIVVLAKQALSAEEGV